MLNDGPGSTSRRIGHLIRGIELDGFALMPDVVPHAQIESVRADLEQLELEVSTYSSAQHFAHDVQWSGSDALFDLIGCEQVLEFLSILFGDDVLFVSATYARTDPGYCGMALHTDGQPYGSNIFGARASCPVVVRALYYLDDLTAARAPFRVVPSSHLGMHIDANPYRRHLHHIDERIVCGKAGSALLINHRVFHAVAPNSSGTSRAVVAVAYRPAWAGPALPVPGYTAAQLCLVPTRVRHLFRDPNTRIDTSMVNWSADMPTDAPGLGTRRWAAGQGHDRPDDLPTPPIGR